MSEQYRGTAVVLGNGPSLKGFDFLSLKEVDSLGMNAAYRYWERISWYPTHYVCLDDQLIETHADAIYDLIITDKVKTAFLITKILDFHPGLLERDNVFFLESFNKTRQKRVADRGVPYISSVPFRESDPSKVTTGAYAIRFAAHLGYREVTVLGVDLRYVEIISEAKQTGGTKLEIMATPTTNPNYFFDDYQQAGDKFNIPNPDSHGCNLHASAFKVLANDIVQFKWSAQIYNSNRQSVLFDDEIFPFRDIRFFIHKLRFSKTDKEKILIAGNGPSLRDIDFNTLRDINWLGMNAAYRYWDDVGIYPTIYCCLDKVVVKSHAYEIKRLLKETNISYFFLLKDILEVVPELENEPTVWFLEDLVGSTENTANIFHTIFSDKRTTGSWAVRFAIYLGYRDIYLSGIDCNYVEVIDEAERTGKELELKINAEVNNNPNYFFSEYQKPGDLYQIPNPERHFGNLHLQSFEALNVDILRLKLSVSIYNLANKSQLNKFGVYPFMRPSQALGYADLGAVVVPLTIEELEQFLLNIQLWDSAAFLPLKVQSPIVGSIFLHVFFDGEYSQEIYDKLSAVWCELKFVNSQFKKLRVTFLGIPSELNAYIRDRNVDGVSTKSGPNVHFLSMMYLCRTYNKSFLMECDCLPAKSGWLDDLNDYCRRTPNFWVSGSHLSRLGTVDPAFALHINGNAIYATGNEEFIEFLDTVMAPSLLYLIYEKESYHLAYDCLISKVYTYGLGYRKRRNLKKPSDEKLMNAYYSIQDNLDKFVFADFIKNISHVEGDISESELVSFLDSGSPVVHSKRLRDLVTTLHERSRLGFIENWPYTELSRRLKDTFIKISDLSVIPFHYYSNDDQIEFKKFDRSNCEAILDIKRIDSTRSYNENLGAYILFSVDDTSIGDIMYCELTMFSTSLQNVLIKFCRDGAGQYVEDQCEVEIVQGEKTFKKLSFVCKDVYAKIRLFVKPVDTNEGKLKLFFSVHKMKENYASNKLIQYFPINDKVLFLYKDFQNAAQKLKLTKKHITLKRKGEAAERKILQVKEKDCVSSYGMMGSAREKQFPRLLMIDSTVVGHGSATGQLKQTFLGDWPNDSFLQIWEQGGAESTFHIFELKQTIKNSQAKPVTYNELVERCRIFQPDVIYFRPVDSVGLFNIAERITSELDRPLVIHMMDDWPERLRNTNVEKFIKLDSTLRRLAERARLRLSICEDMSSAYKIRYGGDWVPLANGVDLTDFQTKRWGQRASVSREAPFVIRYLGGLAEDMTYASIAEIAHVVSLLQNEFPVRFEIYTMEWYRKKAEDNLAVLPGVFVSRLVDEGDYQRCLSEADALVIAYNFDPVSCSYIGLSLANKMPECFASGVPVLAYGPANVATISYLKKSGCAHVVDIQDRKQLRTAIQSLITRLDYCRQVGDKARAYAGKYLAKKIVRQTFINSIVQASLSTTALIKGSTLQSTGVNRMITDNDIKETLVSIRPRMNEEDLSLRLANQFFRDGDYSEAMKLYVMLYKQRPMLKMYSDNALMAARKLGMESIPYWIDAIKK